MARSAADETKQPRCLGYRRLQVRIPPPPPKGLARVSQIGEAPEITPRGLSTKINLFMHPISLGSPPKTVHKIAEVLGLDVEELTRPSDLRPAEVP
jgi:hypothetical protein